MSGSTIRPREGIAVSLPDYTVESLVFDGDPTRIYRARRDVDGAPVMLKTLRDERAAREAAACLRHEFEMTRRLAVPSVIHAYGLERHNGFPVVVFEDFGGDSLNNLVQHRQLPLDELLRIALQLAKGLGEIHAANIIHKDINPSNVVYNPATGVVKIIDFGISTYLTREQAAIAGAQVFEGSLPYISPEQTGRMNRSIDYRTDFYSLGVTLYELLTQRPLFIVSEAIEWFHAHIARQPKAPTDIDPAIPQAVSEIVMKLLAKTAEDRYQSARGICADLQRCLDELERDGNITPFALGREDAPDRFQILQRLYGREAQSEELLASFDRVSRGSCELMLVSGHSGIGKTCLIRELYKPITERRGYFVAGKYDQLHRNVPYSALILALRELVRQLLTEPEERLARWRNKIRRALGPNAQLMVDLIGELELVIGPQPGVPVLAPMETEQRFHQVFHNFITVFCAPEHPLTVFLDDLQWADPASLKLLERLTGSSRHQYLFLIGAYRDNEVDAGHPLALALKDLRARNATIRTISLGPLDRRHLTELLADALSCPRENVAELAELVEQKTAGNPFFTEEFLKSLHRAALIQFSSESGRWTWDIERIRAQQITDNVVDLMAERLRRLAPETLRLLELAACVGNRFTLSVLAVVSEQSPALVAERLRPGMTEGLIAPIGDAYQLLELEQIPEAGDLTVELAFAHDRIQQAAYSLLDNEDRKQAHLKIGRLLLQRFANGQREERLFEITNHLNVGVDLIEDPEELAVLRRLNVAAGKRAKASSAYRTAFNYFTIALSLLDDHAWRDDYAHTLELYSEAAEAAYLCGEDEATERHLEAGLAGARNLPDKVKLYLVQVSACIARGEPRKAIDIALPVLAQLGHRYPKKPKQHHILLKLAGVMWRLRDKTMDDLRALPEMTDPLHLAAMRIGERLGRAAMFVEPNLLPLMILQGIDVSLRHGYSEVSLSSYAAFGMILAFQLGQPERGVAFGELALELTERLQAKSIEGPVLHIHNALVRHWKEPLANTFEGLEEAYRRCMEMGDFEYAALAAVVRASHTFGANMDVERWRDEVDTYLAAVKPLKQEAMLDFLACYRQSADNLMGYADDPAQLRGRFYDIDEMFPKHLESDDEALIFNSLRIQADFHYLFGRYAEALAFSVRANRIRGGSDGFFHAVRSNMFDSLIHLANMETASKTERRRLLRHVARNQRTLKKWATTNPANSLSKFKLVEAEMLRWRGRDMEAQTYYDEAIRLAHEQGFICEEALAHELCGRMHMAAERRAVGEPYLTRACNLYRNWGAKAIADHLTQQFPTIGELANRASGTQTFMAPMSNIDVTSLMKALRTIVDEKVHSRMVENVVATAVEFAGAQRGLLMLGNAEGELRIEGEVDIDLAAPRTLQSLPVTEDSAAQTIINYVSRTGSSIVVHDAQQPNEDIAALQRDPYIQRFGVRSILCLPILSGVDDGKKLTGILYLENNRATGTFTRERFDTLEIICIAAAGRLELSRKAAIDGLTDLFNHDHFQAMLRQEFSIAKEQGRPLALILIDIDQFKRFNDTWGHQLGDRVLREVAQLIKNASRNGDTVARYGGEEMAVILPNATATAAEDVAERIRCVVEQHVIQHDDNQLRVTISLGVANLAPSTPDPDALLRNADAALYRSKANGRNRLTVA